MCLYPAVTQAMIVIVIVRTGYAFQTFVCAAGVILLGIGMEDNGISVFVCVWLVRRMPWLPIFDSVKRCHEALVCNLYDVRVLEINTLANNLLLLHLITQKSIRISLVTYALSIGVESTYSPRHKQPAVPVVLFPYWMKLSSRLSLDTLFSQPRDWHCCDQPRQAMR